MSWQDDLRQLDSELSEGKISIDEHRKRRDSLLAAASSTAAPQPPDAQPQAPEQPEPAGFTPPPAPSGTAQPPAAPEMATPQATPDAPLAAPPVPPMAPAAQASEPVAQQPLQEQSPPETAAERTQVQAPVPQETAAERTQVQPPVPQEIAAERTQVQAPVPQETAAERTQVQPPVPAEAPQSPPAEFAQAQSALQEPARTQHVAPPSAAESTSVLRGVGQGGAGQGNPHEAQAERTQWVARNPAQGFDNADRTQSIAPGWGAEAERTQHVPMAPPNGGYSPAQQPGGYSALASGLQQNRGTGPRPGASAGEAWQPNWHHEWDPGPGGAPFDAFGMPRHDPTDSFAAEPKKKSPLSGRRVLFPLIGLLVLALVAAGLWVFVFSGDSHQQAQQGGGGAPKELPANLDGMVNALPKLPGVPNSKIGPTIPASVAAAQGLYPAQTADTLANSGHQDVVYKASTDGTQQFGVLAVQSEDPQGISQDILGQQQSDGWQQAQQPNMPKGSTGLERTDNGITFHRVLYTTGKWTIFIGVSPTNVGNDARIEQEFGDLVKAISAAVPAGQ